jgi:two-component system, NarL family, response regulator LiaR
VDFTMTTERVDPTVLTMAPPPLRPVGIAVVDDYDLVVAGISAMLVDHTDAVNLVAASGDDPASSAADVVLYDPTGPSQGGAPRLADLVGADRARVAVFSWETDPAAVQRALALGAAGYLFKGLSATDLISSVLAIHTGRVVTAVPPETGDRSYRPPLSMRESEVLALIAQGLTNSEIAERTYLSVNSVKSYIRSGYRKIGVTRRSQAVRWGLERSQPPT